MISIADWRYQSRKKLNLLSDTADIEINAVLCSVLRKETAWCLANSDFVLETNTIQELNQKIDLLLQGMPLAYVLESIEFYGLKFYINHNVLIPRPETELLVEHAINWINNQSSIRSFVDVGTGSGVIAISIMNYFSELTGIGIDISRNALNVAIKNRNFHRINKLDFIQSDCLDGVNSKFDMILANLPYVSEHLLPDLEVSKFEPKQALNGGEEGLEIYKKLIKQIPSHINTPGLVLLEIQFDQSSRIIEEINKSLPHASITIIKDYSEHDRIIKIEV
jgi:release factor glutamine methyltransferase